MTPSRKSKRRKPSRSKLRYGRGSAFEANPCDVIRFNCLRESEPDLMRSLVFSTASSGIDRVKRNVTSLSKCLSSIHSDGGYDSRRVDVSLPLLRMLPHQRSVYDAVFSDKCNRFFLLWHRQAGKDFLCFNILVSACLMTKGINCWFVFPFLVQAKRAVWDSVLDDGTHLLDHIPLHAIESINKQELSIRFVNGSSITFIDVNSQAKTRGTRLHWIVFSEFAFMRPERIRAINFTAGRSDSKIIYNTTPNRKNHAYNVYCEMSNDPKSYVSKLTVDDTDVISKSMMEVFRKESSEETINQELYCSFEDGGSGYYYTEAIDRTEELGNVGNGSYYEYDPNGLVFTSWDIGFKDQTAIIFFQIQYEKRNALLKRYSVKVIDCFQRAGEDLSFFMKKLLSLSKERGYVYGNHFVPRDFSSRYVCGSYRASANLANFRATVLRYKYNLMQGINLSRNLIVSSTFCRSKTLELFSSLNSYRKEYNLLRQQYQNKPIHDQYSDFADSFRYLAIAYNDFYNTIEGADMEYRRKMKAFRNSSVEIIGGVPRE